MLCAIYPNHTINQKREQADPFPGVDQLKLLGWRATEPMICLGFTRIKTFEQTNEVLWSIPNIPAPLTPFVLTGLLHNYFKSLARPLVLLPLSWFPSVWACTFCFADNISIAAFCIIKRYLLESSSYQRLLKLIISFSRNACFLSSPLNHSSHRRGWLWSCMQFPETKYAYIQTTNASRLQGRRRYHRKLPPRVWQ